MQGRRFEDNDSAAKVAPVKVGQELDVRIEGVGEKGDGIAKVQGFVLFIPGVRAGDEVRIKVTRVLAKVGFADVLSRKERSEDDSEVPIEETEEEGKREDSGEEGGEDGGSDDYGDDDGEYQDSEDF